MANLQIRKANINDAKLILKFIKHLAIYEKAEDEVVADVAAIKNTVFKENSNVSSIICMLDDKPIGFAVYFYNYSTWLAKKGIYIEDVFVLPKYRKLGAGKKILKYIAKLAYDNGYERIEWSVLDWNKKAINFYESIGAKPQSEWITYRMDKKTIKKFSSNSRI